MDALCAWRLCSLQRRNMACMLPARTFGMCSSRASPFAPTPSACIIALAGHGLLPAAGPCLAACCAFFPCCARFMMQSYASFVDVREHAAP